MSLTLVHSSAQTSSPNMTPAQAATDHNKLLEMAANHVQSAARITDVDDLRYFNMGELNEVRLNLYLALELLAVLKQ